MAFSWQGISLSPGEEKTVSVIMKSGAFDSNSPTLTMDASAIPPACWQGQTLEINGFVTGINDTASITVILVINSDCSQIYTVVSGLGSEWSFAAELSLVTCRVSVGTSKLTFYAVDNSGCVSSGVNFMTEVIAEASSSPTHKPGSVTGGVVGGVVGGLFVLAIVVSVLLAKVFHKRWKNEEDDMAELARSQERISLAEWSGAVTGKSFMRSEKTVI
jgi:hypothetical protein